MSYGYGKYKYNFDHWSDVKNAAKAGWQTKNPEAALMHLGKSQWTHFKSNPRAYMDDVKTAGRVQSDVMGFDKLVDRLRGVGGRRSSGGKKRVRGTVTWRPRKALKKAVASGSSRNVKGR